MPTALNAQLPDGAILRQIAAVLIEGTPADWSKVEFTFSWTAADLAGARCWVTDAEGRRAERRPPPAHGLLYVLRARQVAAGHDPWRRCDLTVTHASGAPAHHLTARFSFDAS